MSTYATTFNRPWTCGREYDYVRECVASGHTSGNGPFTRRCEAIVNGIVGGQRTLLTTSCTDALEMCALLLRLQPGDEVIVPSFTFVSTANAFAIFGARPVFADVRPDTLNLDPAHLPRLVTERTRAIVVVHYAGIGCDMDEILAFAGERGIAVIEDNAHGLMASYRGRPLGSLGALATQSFHETKNVICGEGGALVVNDPELVERAEIIRDKGTDRARFFRGEVDKYTWVDLGSSYLPSDLTAAFLLAQLEARDEIQRLRAGVWNRYHDALGGWAREVGAALPCVPADRQQAYHMFHLLMPTPAARGALLTHLRERGIQAVFHYVPLHLAEMGRRYGGRTGACPVAEDVSERLIRLPFFNGLGESEQRNVIDALLSFRP